MHYTKLKRKVIKKMKEDYQKTITNKSFVNELMDASNGDAVSLTVKANGVYSNLTNVEPLKMDLSDIFKGALVDSYPAIVVDDDTIAVIDYIEVRGKSDYSMMDSIAKLDDIIKKAEVSVGVQDHGVGYALYEFNQDMLSAGKKPINGYEAYIKTDSDEYDHLVIIAKNFDGYKELVRLISLAGSRVSIEDDKSPIARPWNLLSDFEHTDNLMVLHGYNYSFINKAILNGHKDDAIKYVEQLKTIFNPEDVYLEIQYHNDNSEFIVNDALFEIAEETKTKSVLTTDYHEINAEDKDALDLAQAIGMKKQLGEKTAWKLDGENWHLHSSSEMNDAPQELKDMTIEIYNKVDTYSLYVKDNFMPTYHIPEQFKNEDEYFEYLAHKGLKTRLENENVDLDTYNARLQKEIDIIEEMGFSGYFLIVADFINYAKRNYDSYDDETANRWRNFIKRNNIDPAPIAIGPARGSAAGSLVAYAMAITEVDPLKYDLLFERFLNPERVSMPDIDTDIPDNKRAEVVSYVKDYYNPESSKTTSLNDRVAGIATFGTLKTKGVFKAVVRGLYNDATFGAKLANVVNDDMSFAEIKDSQEMIAFIESDERTSTVIDYAEKLSGIVTNLSQHAAGYVITPSAVSSYLPVTYAPNKSGDGMEILTAYTHVEDNGLLKMDFLGLKAMTVINDAINSINADYPNKMLTFSDIIDEAITDLDVFKFLSRGNLGDIFQLASGGMMDVITRSLSDVNEPGAYAKATNGNLFARLIAGIAMYRPGPMAYIDTFVSNALNPNDIKYAVPEMKDVLQGSFGLLIYQESIMALLQVVAGFTLGGADVARRTIGKKRVEDLPALKKLFIEGNGDDISGGLALGHPKEALEDLWGDIETFAAYGFNKSHAAGYAHISIAEAWLAYYYPAYYGAATLNHGKNTDDINTFISIYKKRQITILPASVSVASSDFSVETSNGDKPTAAIRFGLGGIRSVAKKAPAIVSELKANGKFIDYYDFLSRMARNQTDASLNKSSIEALIYSGALDVFYGSRKSKVEAIEKTAGLMSLMKKDDHLLFDDTTIGYFNIFLGLNSSEFDNGILLEKEHYYTGFYISGHPVDNFKNQIARLENYFQISDLSGDEKNVELVGVVTNVHKIMTKRQELMCFLTIEDTTGTTEVIMFPDTFKDFGRFAEDGRVVIVRGDTQSDKRLIVSSANFAVDKIISRDVDHFQVRLSNRLKIASHELEQILDESRRNNIGDVVKLTYVIKDTEYSATKALPTLSLSNDNKTIKFIQDLLGQNSFNIIWNSDTDK